MSLILQVNRYVQFNRKLGYKFSDPERLLREYAEFAMALGDRWTRSDRIVAWASNASSPSRASLKLHTVRNFALWLHAEDARHEVPPRDAVGRRIQSRPSPHLLTRSEVRRVMDAALSLPTRDPIAPYTWHYLFGLMAVTGMRRSEALGLRLSDITPDGLLVRESKFRKSRLLPLHDDTSRALDKYVAIRMRLVGPGDHLFVLATGKPPAGATATRAFLRLLRELGLRGPPGETGPRLHDLRHSFCAWSLESLNDEEEPSRHMLALATYVGHSKVANTYWYLKATPPLLRRIAKRAERAQTGRTQS